MDDGELNIENREALKKYLIASGHCAAGALQKQQVLTGGVSSRTVKVIFADGRAWVLKQALPKLRVEADWFCDPRRVHREALGIRVLGELAPAGSIPKLIFEDQRHHVIAMEAVPSPHENWKDELLKGKISSTHVEQFGRLLGTIHRKAWQRRDVLRAAFLDRTFFESLRLEPYYEYSASQEVKSAAFYADLINETRSHDVTLVHGDYSPKNCLLHAGRLILLDHEVIHWGDPAFDVGFAIAHLLSKAHHLPAKRSVFCSSTRHFWDEYYDTLGDIPLRRGLAPRCIRHAIGCLLARVVGRSPLEYLTPEERTRQRKAAVALIDAVPKSIEEFIHLFSAAIAR